MMYKLLIVDDEKWIRKGIISKLEHNDYRFSWVGEADDGDTALSIINDKKPDIVITDIKMNVMDGIQLIEKAKYSFPDIEFIIISGYAEFEYAEQALNIGVSGYLLKPVSDENIRETLDKAIENLKRRNDYKHTIQQNKSLEERNRDLRIERFLNHIFHSPVDIDTDNLDPPFNNKKNNYGLLLIHIDSSSYSLSDFKYQNIELIKFAIKNIVNELCGDHDVYIVNNQKDLSQVFILLTDQNKDMLRDRCARTAINSFSKIQLHLGLSITIAISTVESRLTPELFKKAKAALDLRLVYGSGKIFNREEIKPSVNRPFPEHKLNLLSKCIELKDFKNIQVILSDIFKKSENKAAVNFKFLSLELVNILLKSCIKMGIDVQGIYESGLITGEILDYFDSTEEIVRYFYTTIADILNNHNECISDCKSIVHELTRYIDNNCSDNLTVKFLACRFAMNPNYLSAIFKSETGIGLNRYITETRIKKACSLLKSTDSNVADIAQCVGYKDTQYFYRVFKKIKGRTPLEYRNNNL